MFLDAARYIPGPRAACKTRVQPRAAFTKCAARQFCWSGDRTLHVLWCINARRLDSVGSSTLGAPLNGMIESQWMFFMPHDSGQHSVAGFVE